MGEEADVGRAAGRTGCAVCGIVLSAEALVRREGEWLCPRCYALMAPATITASRVAATGGALPGPGSGPESDRGGRPDAGPAAASGAEAARRWRERLADDVREWAVGRSWWVRAPVLAWMVWILFHYWDSPWYSTIWRGMDLAVHEIGHILWAPLGEFMGFAGGTLTQLLVPVAAGAVLLRQRDWFGVAVAACWLGINCFEIVEYAGDALARRLPLVSPTTGSPQHDWTYMLGELGLLRHTGAVAAGWQWAGRLVMTAGIVFGGWVLWLMARGGEEGTAG